MAVTFTENVHELLAASVALLKMIELELGIAVIVPPPQLPESPFGLETRNPDGSGSLK